jgi:hypothetical protein
LLLTIDASRFRLLMDALLVIAAIVMLGGAL